MKQVSTLFLKIAVMLIGIPILALCIFGLTWLANHPVHPNYAHILYPILIIMCVSVIPFFIALYQAFQLLSYIDKNKAFSKLSVRALKNIKYCAITISILYVIGMPFFYFLAEMDDAPGIIVIGLVISFASMVIAVFAAVLQKLLKEAIDIKSENDLTV
ncbi:MULTISPECIES: DUF2975 domain-containing protein [Bacillus cereus group]|uniref:DUF2975 domain-containing protein n=1 Tax=Bacillus cereus TaxID=1396 RepID=A0AA44TGA8_BACCE|nr:MULTISPECIES: DUF2975 domain-containing protein [Bacillus cereus group]PFA24729.1 hypothetical protein CN373_02475 [Bacillus cereus]PFN09163.1 hypothetical protein COJ55_04045 [Bacillus cereus]PFO80062.1 hypothetical protein COJ77_18955 [Bacillus cereus]PFR30156.1 hypothetical protein COK19_05250 [Bacillus cereus]PFS06383.1 hypothetical protein COK38_03025 [Bacillus cereus]